MSEYFLDDSGNTINVRYFADGSRGVRAVADRAACARAVADAWLAASRTVPAKFAVGTALHESFYTLNEKDIEPNGHTTWGVFMLDRDDVWMRARMPEKDPLKLDEACEIFAAVVEYYKTKIIDGANAFNTAHGLPTIDSDNPPADVWSYCAIAHNQGLGSASSGKGALGTIARYGLDWNRYRDDNGDSQNISAERSEGIYGDDVVSGGADWSDSWYAGDVADAPSSPSSGDDPLDASGNAIPAPTVSALASSRVRLGLVALLLFLILFAALSRAPLKVSV